MKQYDPKLFEIPLTSVVNFLQHLYITLIQEQKWWVLQQIRGGAQLQGMQLNDNKRTEN
jgi:hypothetical protein